MTNDTSNDADDALLSAADERTESRGPIGGISPAEVRERERERRGAGRERATSTTPDQLASSEGVAPWLLLQSLTARNAPAPAAYVLIAFSVLLLLLQHPGGVDWPPEGRAPT